MYFESFYIRCDLNQLDILVYVGARKQFMIHTKKKQMKKQEKR